MEATLEAELVPADAFHMKTTQLLLDNWVAFLALLAVKRQLDLLRRCTTDNRVVVGLKTIVAKKSATLITDQGDFFLKNRLGENALSTAAASP